MKTLLFRGLKDFGVYLRCYYPLVLLVLLNAQELYDFNLNTRVNINGQPHFKIDYYPGTTNTNYKGDFYPDVESNTNVKKHTFISDCTIIYNTDYRTIVTPTPDSTQVDSNGYLNDRNTVLIVPVGVTVTIDQTRTIPTLLIKGRVILKQDTQVFYEACKTIVFPGGVFESVPKNNNFNHTIQFAQYLPDSPAWDPLKTSSFISLGGNVTIRGLNTDSVWTGSNSSFTSYGSTFLRSFPFTTDFTPVYKMSGTRSSNNVVYSMDNYYTSLKVQTGGYTSDTGTFGGAGYIFIRPWDKNVWIMGYKNCSMVFTGSSIVDIQNSVFYGVGHTTPSPIDDNTLDSSNNVNHYGSNLPDRYPITLLHNKLAVNIQNNVFLPVNIFMSSSQTPRAHIGAKRSFGNSIGNAFVLTRGSSGISLLHGTEQFSVNYNAFISLYTDATTPTSRSYPDIDYLNGGIVTTSPYSTYQGNAFEGTFKGGAMQVIPLQNRATLTGLSSDKLLGIYSGLTQDNNDYKTNSLWSTVVFKDNFFAGEAEFRVTYAKTSQPPIKINFLGGWYIGQRPSLTLPSNVANIELFYDSPYIANSLSVADKQTPFNTNTHTGEYNAVSIKNSIALATYTFFSDSFSCKYISVVDSKFSHYSSTANFIKKNTDQLFMSNVNGTRSNINYLVPYFFPLFDLSPPATSSPVLPVNQINMSFIPNFDYTLSNGQNINFIVNDVVQSTLSNLLKANFVVNVTSTWNVVNFPTLANGLYTVLVSSKARSGSTYFEVGPYYGNTYIVNSNAANFYLGIDLTSTITPPQRALTIFGNQWTRCGWISSAGKCTTTGSFSSVTTTPSSVLSVAGTATTTADEASMLTSYLVNNVASSIPSVVNITLSGNQVYKFFIYTYNPTFTGSNILDPLPIFNIKINGKYQEPFTRSVPSYQRYQKLGPFYWNNELSTNQVLNIEWASDNIKNTIPISGIEIYSSITTPYAIPI